MSWHTGMTCRKIIIVCFVVVIKQNGLLVMFLQYNEGLAKITKW